MSLEIITVKKLAYIGLGLGQAYSRGRAIIVDYYFMLQYNLSIKENNLYF